jgi:hypothetical protein
MALETFINQVRFNCQVASAGQAGLFSLCGILLRLRQLYKWEHQLPPWREPEPGVVLAWIDHTERSWEALEGQTWRPLASGEISFDPCAVAAVNEHLFPQGLAYGAGLSRGLAPTCFLGELAEMRRGEEVTILVLGAELARDLDASPALCQGRLIYARKQTLAYYLWDHLSDPTQQNNPFLKIALAAHQMTLEGLLRAPEAHAEQFQALVAAELEAVIHHEVGEALEPSLETAFPTILELYPQTRVELWARALKDALADVNEAGRLFYLIKERQLPSLALMLAWRPGLYSLLLPELEPAFGKMLATGDWEVLDRARRDSLERLRQMAAGVNLLLASEENVSPQWVREELTRQYLAPLGL